MNEHPGLTAVRAVAPGGIGNLGPGFDTLGLALRLYLRVEVRDGEGNLVFEGDLVIGEVKRVEVDPPVTVSTDNGGALSVTLNGRDMGFIGEPDQPATEVYQRPSE